MLSPPAAACSGWIGHPSVSFNAGCRWETTGGECTAPALLQAGVRWPMGSLYRYTMCKRTKKPAARTVGACWALSLGPLAASAGWRCARSCGKPYPGRRSDAPGLGCFRFVGVGRWNAQWGLEEKAPSLPVSSIELPVGSVRSMAMLTFRTNWLLPPPGGAWTVTRPARAPRCPGPGKRQLPG